MTGRRDFSMEMVDFAAKKSVSVDSMMSDANRVKPDLLLTCAPCAIAGLRGSSDRSTRMHLLVFLRLCNES